MRDKRNFDSSEFDSTGVKLYIYIHNEVRDLNKNSIQPEIRVIRIRDNESQLYLYYNVVFNIVVRVEDIVIANTTLLLLLC